MSRHVLGATLLALWLQAPRFAHAAEPTPVTNDVWREAVVSVHDLERSARFFLDIGGYEVKWRGDLSSAEISAWGLPSSADGEAMLIGPENYSDGLIRLVRFDVESTKNPMRPGSRAWDTGCYFSLMVRMRDMESIYDDAIRLGWWTETPITDLHFGQSSLKVVIFRGPDGLQVQGYERLSPPLPESIPDFERMTGPFNVMQMVSDRNATYSLFTEVLSFDTFYLGEPFTASEPTPTPLGIPVNLTTTVPYRAAIVFPRPGEFGRMEMIEIMGLDGFDYADRCTAPNLGILAVRFPVDDVDAARDAIAERGGKPGSVHSYSLKPYGRIGVFDLRSPDGAIVQFFESEAP